MNRVDEYAGLLTPLVEHPSRAQELERLLLAESRLPGPRANLEMAAAFVRSLAGCPLPSAWLDTLRTWAATEPTAAPTGNPREFLCFCAVVALGSLYGSHECPFLCTEEPDCPRWPIRCALLVQDIRRAGNDPRWRVREAAAMALQQVGTHNAPKLRGILDCWMESGSPADHRAVVAALAHPPLLEEEECARYAIAASERILASVAATPFVRRRNEEFRILVKGLSYALSVFAARLPEEGFALLTRWSLAEDRAIDGILRANLGKRRLSATYPRRADALLRRLGERRRGAP